MFMANLIAKFTPKNSSKRYAFELAPQGDLNTAIKQFQLDLPGKYKLDDLHLRLLNGVDPKSDPHLNCMEFFKALVLLFQKHKLKDDEYSQLYVAKKQLTTVRIRNAFKDAPEAAIELSFAPYWFYIFKKPLMANATKTKAADTDIAAKEPALNEITDFITLQKRALKLEQSYKDLQQGAETYKQLMDHADETNISLTKQLEKLDHDKQKDEALKQKQHDYLKKHYQKYLHNDAQKIAFMINMLQHANQPAVQKLTKGNTQRLWNLIKAVCDYD